jgi:hypothetical protein
MQALADAHTNVHQIEGTCKLPRTFERGALASIVRAQTGMGYLYEMECYLARVISVRATMRPVTLSR